jgi:hypothetical protein
VVLDITSFLVGVILSANRFARMVEPHLSEKSSQPTESQHYLGYL